jgi:two-component system response regulator HydG
MRRLLDYSWPGNVRELENSIEHAVVLAKDEQIGISGLPSTLSELRSDEANPVKQTIVANEAELVRETLEQCNWNKTAAASRLGISRSTLYEKLKKYQLNKPTLH